MVEEPQPPAGAPQQIGPYRILSEIGEGGMGVVYLAQQENPSQRVALKLIRADRQGKQFLARFQMEKEALERLDHPNVARLFDAGISADGRPYLVMEYVPGLPVDEYCDEKRLSIDERIDLFGQICAGAQHAHTNGIMHRDIKPSNILVTEVDDRPVPKIIDFGLARAIGASGQRPTLFEELHRIIGTLAYMSPEQAGREPSGVDTRTDVYSLGVLLYQLLSGRLPFSTQDLELAGPLGVQHFLREHEPVRPSTQFSTTTEASTAAAALRRGNPRTLWRRVAGELDWIVLKAMHKDRTRRYETVRDLAHDLERFLRHQPVEAGPDTLSYRLRKWLRRNRRGAIAAGVALGSLGAALLALALSLQNVAAANRRAILAADPLLLDGLQRAADELWPALPAKLPEMDDWLQRADELIRRHADPASVADTNDPGFAAQLAAFTADEGPVASVRRRRIAAATIVERSTVEGGRDLLWQQCAERVRNDPRFAKLELRPQVGLVPLNRDPVSGFEEFAVLESGAIPVRAESGTLSLDVSTAIVLVLLPGGMVSVGASPDHAVRKDPKATPNEGPVVEVRLDPFLIGKYELTQAQWQRVMGDNPSRFQPCPFYDAEVAKGAHPKAPTLLNPVESFSWDEAMAMLRRLDLTLPTEARWEYAARGGTNGPFYFFNNGEPDWRVFGRHANIADSVAAQKSSWPEAEQAVALGIADGHLMSAPVGQLAANPYGLHDVHGNVWEMCLDWYADLNHADGMRDGDGMCLRGEESMRVVRGGSFKSTVNLVRVTYRQSDQRRAGWYAHGLRAARPLTVR